MPFVERDNGRLFYEVVDLAPSWRPDPPTIVFHHGIAATHEIWSGWIPALCERYRIVRFDVRGFGQSTVSREGYWYSMDGLIDDLLAVAAAGGAERFHLVGESLGGTVGLATALAAPDRVLSLTVSNGSHRGGSIQNARSWGDDIARLGRPVWARHATEARLISGVVEPEKWEWFYQQLLTCSVDAMLSLARLLLGCDLSQQVGGIAQPVLLLCPDASPFIAVSVMADLHARLPDSELQVFPHSRHGLPLSHAAEGAQSLASFLARRFAGRQSPG
jgi:pimeloyl-ACP methyl ester carboxylesterase